MAVIRQVLLFHVKLFFFIILPSSCFAQTSTTTIVEVKPLPTFYITDASIINLLEKDVDYNRLQNQYKEWYYWTNYSRQRPRAFWDSVVMPILKIYPKLNTSYASSLRKDLFQTVSLPFVKPNPILLKTSQSHAIDLSRNTPGRLSHNSTNGMAFEKRIFQAGIERCAAENLSLGSFNTVFALVLLYLDEGLPDVGHRRNLLSPYYTELGIGISKLKGSSTVVVQDFACDQGK